MINLGGGVAVACPKCSGEGVVKVHRTSACDGCSWSKYDCGRGFRLTFVCSSCGAAERKEETNYRLVAEGVCQNCERFFKKNIDADGHNYRFVNTACPHCGVRNHATIHKKDEGQACYSYHISRVDGQYFCNGYALYFSTSYRSNPIWAYNRVHLQYLLDYVTADIRQKPSPLTYKGMAYHLPKYIHLAKNREGIAKILKKMCDF